jgi:hypothetical protein
MTAILDKEWRGVLALIRLVCGLLVWILIERSIGPIFFRLFWLIVRSRYVGYDISDGFFGDTQWKHCEPDLRSIDHARACSTDSFHHFCWLPTIQTLI